jgi:hypothetical protein
MNDLPSFFVALSNAAVLTVVLALYRNYDPDRCVDDKSDCEPEMRCLVCEDLANW